MLAGLLMPTLLAAPPQVDVRALMLEARALQLRGGGTDPEAAAAIYRRVVALVPQSAEARLRLSEALQEARDLDGAVAPAEKAVALAPRNGEARAHLALLQVQRAQKDVALLPQARKDLESAVALLPQDPELWARLGEVSEQQHDAAAALRAWLRLGRLRPSFTPAWERAYIQAVATQNYAGKREAVLALNAHRPDERQLRMLEDLAREQIQAGFLAHAEESFLLLAKHLPQEPALWENISLVRLQTSRFAEALDSLGRAEALKPTPRISFNMALALMNLGRFSEAEARLKALLDDASAQGAVGDGAQALYAESLLLQGKGTELLAFVKRQPPHDKVAGEMQVFICQAHISLNDWRTALAAIQEGIRRFPKVPFFAQAATLPSKYLEYSFFSRKEARSSLEQLHKEGMAALWSEFRRWDKCLEAIQQARALGQVRDVDILLMQSSALEQLDRPKEALKVLREAQAMAPANPMVQNNLGYLLLEQDQDLPEAATLIEASAKATPDNGNVVDSLGWAQFKLGKLAEAETTLRRAAELSPFSPEVRKHLGEVLLRQGKLEEAADQWERALAFVFPDRPDLEKRLGDLRLRIAKDQAQKVVEPAPESEDDEEAP
jgi:tetratricopeptide (TPR) repeat protein